MCSWYLGREDGVDRALLMSAPFVLGSNGREGERERVTGNTEQMCDVMT